MLIDVFLQPQRGDGDLKTRKKRGSRSQREIHRSFVDIWSNELKKVPIIFTIASTIKDTRSDFLLRLSL